MGEMNRGQGLDVLQRNGFIGDDERRYYWSVVDRADLPMLDGDAVATRLAEMERERDDNFAAAGIHAAEHRKAREEIAKLRAVVEAARHACNHLDHDDVEIGTWTNPLRHALAAVEVGT